MKTKPKLYYLIEDHRESRMWVPVRISVVHDDGHSYDIPTEIGISEFHPRERFRVGPGMIYQKVDKWLVPVPDEFRYPGQWRRHLEESRLWGKRISEFLKWKSNG